MKRCLRCGQLFDGEGYRCPACGYAPEAIGGFPIFAPDLASHNDGYSSDFFANLANLEKGHFWFEARNKILLLLIQRYFPDAARILEIGCGTGFVLQSIRGQLSKADLYGTDLLVEGLQFAAQRVPSATLLQIDARNIPYYQEFDLIGAFDVIEHIEDDRSALSQIYNALRPGGGMVLSVPQHQFLWSTVDDVSYHKRRYSKMELISKACDAGFKVLTTTSFVSLLLPLMMLARMRKPTEKRKLDLYAEFKIGSSLNALLSAIMKMEFAAIRRHITFRFGGSRILVAIRPQ